MTNFTCSLDNLAYELGGCKSRLSSYIKNNYEQNINYCLIYNRKIRGGACRYEMYFTQETFDLCKAAWFDFKF